MSKTKKIKQELNKANKKSQPTKEVEKDFRLERDNSEYLKETISLNIKERKDYTERQIEVLNAMVNDDVKMVILDALFGTGKSHLAVLAALKLLNEGKCKKILYVRQPVESGKSIGFQPGDTQEKTAAFNAVLFDKLGELLLPIEAKKIIERKIVDCIIPGFIRGRSYDDTILICDESSCLNFQEFILITQRLGKNSKCFFLGDDFQSDIKDSGFERFYNAFDNENSRQNGVRCFKLKEESDIVRSGFMKFCMVQLGVLKFKSVKTLLIKSEVSNKDREIKPPKVEEGFFLQESHKQPDKKRTIDWLKFWR